MVSNKLSKQDVVDRADKLDFPESVVEFFQGHLGQPYGGFPEPLRSKIIRFVLFSTFSSSVVLFVPFFLH